MGADLDILLVNPSLDPERHRDETFRFFWVEAGHSWIPQFAVWLAPYLRAYGFSVHVLDMELVGSDEEQSLLSQWVGRARFVGLSVMTATVAHALRLTRMAKALSPEAQVVWGGIHPTLLPEQTLADPSIDFVVVGEGEEPAAALLAGEPHTRLLGKNTAGVPCAVGQRFLQPDQLVDPDLGVLDVERYFSFQGPEYRNLEILTSRGCPHRCSFCVNTITKNRWRALPADRVTSMISRLHAHYGVRHLFIADENFFADVRRSREIVGAIGALGITWEANIQIGTLLRLDDEMMALIRSSGAQRLRMGAESGSNRLLRILRKGITVEQIAAARDRCLRFGVTPAMSFMTDLPDETIEEKAATIQLAQECGDAGALVIGPQSFRPYPGSDEFEKLRARGLEIPSSLDEWANSTLYTAGMVSREDPRLAALAVEVETKIAAGPTHLVEITNSRAQGPSLANELWVYDVSSDTVPYFDLARANRSGEWLPQPTDAGRSIGPAWKSGSVGDSLSLRMPGRQVRMRLLRHPWSGDVDVRVDGVSLGTTSLYAPQLNIVQLRFDIGSPPPEGPRP